MDLLWGSGNWVFAAAVLTVVFRVAAGLLRARQRVPRGADVDELAAWDASARLGALTREQRRRERERFDKAVKLIGAIFGRAIAKRCREQRGYVLLDGWRFTSWTHGGRPVLYAQVTEEGEWREGCDGAPSLWSNERLFVNVYRPSDLAGWGKPDLKTPPAVSMGAEQSL